MNLILIIFVSIVFIYGTLCSIVEYRQNKNLSKYDKHKISTLSVILNSYVSSIVISFVLTITISGIVCGVMLTNGYIK